MWDMCECLYTHRTFLESREDVCTSITSGKRSRSRHETPQPLALSLPGTSEWFCKGPYYCQRKQTCFAFKTRKCFTWVHVYTKLPRQLIARSLTVWDPPSLPLEQPHTSGTWRPPAATQEPLLS